MQSFINIKKQKIKKHNILIEIYKDMLKNPIFERNKYSKTSTGIYKVGQDSIRLMK